MYFIRRAASACVGTLSLALIVASCTGNADFELESPPDGVADSDAGTTEDKGWFTIPNDGKGQEVTYVGKKSTGDFRGLGQHLTYFPAFALTEPGTALRTDTPGTYEYTPAFANFQHHELDFHRRTFTPDALGDPLGVKAGGGFSDWANFILPNWHYGRSGTIYDKHSRDNSSNIVNQFRINVPNLHAFCLNIITDNTNGRYNPNDGITAKSDSKEAAVPSWQLSFDNQPDMYTFKYTGMEENDRVKINIRAKEAMEDGGGLGGIMVSDISTCCTEVCTLENECGGYSNCGTQCGCTKGENAVGIENGKKFYIRNLQDRGVLTMGVYGLMGLEARDEKASQRWKFKGTCTSDGNRCTGQFTTDAGGWCLYRARGGYIEDLLWVGSCNDLEANWIMDKRGTDDFSGGPAYTMRAQFSHNQYVIGRDRGVLTWLESRNSPNQATEHFIFEEAN